MGLVGRAFGSYRFRLNASWGWLAKLSLPADLFTPCFRGSPMVPCGSALLRSTPQCMVTTNKPGTRHPVPPGKDDFFTAISPEPVSRTQFAELLH